MTADTATWLRYVGPNLDKGKNNAMTGNSDTARRCGMHGFERVM
jgi:hypothetical protein